MRRRFTFSFIRMLSEDRLLCQLPMAIGQHLAVHVFRSGSVYSQSNKDIMSAIILDTQHAATGYV